MEVGEKMKNTQLSARKLSLRLFPILIFFCLFTGCDRQAETPVKVSLSATEQGEAVQHSTNRTTPSLRIAISAVISPKETFILYKELLDYISKKLGVKVELVQRETYAEVNNLVRDKELDLAFVCSGAYVDGHDKFGMELLVAPVAYGEAVYYSYIIVPAQSEAQSLEDLRHKRFAFTDPMSNTGKLAPTYMLARMNEDIDSFFGDYIFTHSHDRSIEMVAHSLVDGAAIDGLIWEYMNTRDPSLTSRTRIIKKSVPYGIPPIVVPVGLDPTLKENLRDLFLNIHKKMDGKRILDKLLIDRFIVIDDRQYDSIREMRSWFAEK